MSVVNGKNVVGTANGKIIACSRSITLNVATSFVETTTVGTGDFATFKPIKHTITGSMEGVVFLAEANKIHIYNLRQLQLSKSVIQWVYERTDESGNTWIESFEGYISNSTDNGAVGDFATFQIEIQGTGAITSTFACIGLVSPQNVVITVTNNTPVYSYSVAWTYDGPYTIGTLSFEYSLDGTTWIALPGTPVGLTLSYNFNSTIHQSHYVRVILTCPNYIDAYFSDEGFLPDSCEPTNVTWQSVDNGNGTQNITFSFTPGTNSTGLTISRSTDGVTYGNNNTGSNTTPRVVTAPLGVYWFKLESANGCVGETIISNVGIL